MCAPSFLLKVGHFGSHLLWLRCCAVQWRFRWFPLPNLKLLEFFSFSPLPLSPCQMPPRSTTPKTPPPNRAKKEEKKVCRSADHDRLSPSLLFFSLFLSLSQFRKGRGENKTGQFPFDFNYRSRCGRDEKRASDCLTIYQLSVVLPFLVLPGSSKLPKCAGKQRLAIEERIVASGLFSSLRHLPSLLHRSSFLQTFFFLCCPFGGIFDSHPTRSPEDQATSLTIRKSLSPLPSPSRLRLRPAAPA